jgi:hypothetical protein
MGFKSKIVPAMRYFRGELPHNYRPRWHVSLLSSEWVRWFHAALITETVLDLKCTLKSEGKMGR